MPLPVAPVGPESETVHTFLILLQLKVANHLTEQGLVLGVQWLRHGGRCWAD